MKSCRNASIVAFGALFVAGVIAACHGETRVDVPPVTSARPTGDTPILSGSPSELAVDGGGGSSTAAAAKSEPPITKLVESATRLDDGLCQTLLFAVAKGKFTAMGEALSAGDVLVVKHAEATEVKGSGLAVEARERMAPCPVRDRPAPEKTVIRANVAPKLGWAGGKMNAHLDVPSKASPDLYLGRLEGTAPVAEHTHPTSWEVLVSIEAAGTFTLEGKEMRLTSKQIVAVPPGAKHAWKPDPGSRLVAVQMYTPPGPEQRFVALAADKDAGVAKDAGAR